MHFFHYSISDCNILTFQNQMFITLDMMRGNQESIILVRKSLSHDTFLTAISMLFLQRFRIKIQTFPPPFIAFHSTTRSKSARQTQISAHKKHCLSLRNALSCSVRSCLLHSKKLLLRARRNIAECANIHKTLSHNALHKPAFLLQNPSNPFSA